MAQRINIAAGDAEFTARVSPIVEWTEDGPVATFSVGLSMEDWALVIEAVSFNQGRLTVTFSKRPAR